MELEDLFKEWLNTSSIEIEGKTYIFSKKTRDKIVFALVREKNQDAYKIVFFRRSGSDNQWKSVPGLRKNGKDYKKGDESNPKHHYVQSAKLNPKITEILEKSEYTGIQLSLLTFIPVEEGRYSDENTFEEQFYEFKNPKLKEEFDLLGKTYLIYQEISRNTCPNDTFENRLTISEMIDMLIKVSGDSKVGERIKSLLNNSEVKKFIELYKLHEIKENLNKLSEENQEVLNEIIKIMNEELIYPTTERIFKAATTSFEPDFTKPPVNTYKKGNINIEEFEVTTPEGDNLIYAMANDDKGRVYIDNVYTKDSGISSYGTYTSLINAGMLVWKPEEYTTQTAHIPEEYKYKGLLYESYDDIADIFSLVPVIKNYREHLKSRGVYVRELKSKKS
jgi:hypothetical protein